jgi:hypothetical protein
MENFDLKKFLVENKLTSNSRLLNEVWDKENWLLHNAGIDYKGTIKIKRELIEESNKRILNERRQGMFNYLKEKLPYAPEYVVYDWFYKSNKNETQENIEGVINKYKDVEWELKENFHMSLDILSDETVKRLKEREGGIEKKGLEGDLERHQTQSDLIKSQGISKEPIILLELLNGKYELVEGWHRTIQLFKLYPEGFEYPNVWIGKSTDGTDISIYI